MASRKWRPLGRYLSGSYWSRGAPIVTKQSWYRKGFSRSGAGRWRKPPGSYLRKAPKRYQREGTPTKYFVWTKK